MAAGVMAAGVVTLRWQERLQYRNDVKASRFQAGQIHIVPVLPAS